MSAFKRINKSDVFVLPYTANKHWSFDSGSLSSNNIFVYTGVRDQSLFDPDNDAQENNQYSKLVFNTINHMFYQEFSGSYIDNSALLRSNNYESASVYRASGSYDDNRKWNDMSKYFPTGSGETIKVLSIPKRIYGNSIKKGTFNISSSLYDIIDDSKGNLVNRFTEPHNFVGNIFYSQGLVVITSQFYQSLFGNNFIQQGDFGDSFGDSFS